MKDCVECRKIDCVAEDSVVEADFTPAMTRGSFLDDLQKAARDTLTCLGQGWVAWCSQVYGHLN